MKVDMEDKMLSYLDSTGSGIIYLSETVSKISFENIECMHRNFVQDDKYNFVYQRANAEIINGIPFQDLKTCLFFKEKSEREKDKKDVELIKKYMNNNNL